MTWHPDHKRNPDFLNKVEQEFAYLVSEFGYREPEAVEAHAPLFRDKVVYVSEAAQRKVEIMNAYHPYDYGFEVNIHDLRTGETTILDHVLRADQDADLAFVARVAGRLRNEAVAALSGRRRLR